ncbi:hypothetical protein F4810DRAFT_676054 [Camillea tinctor]|nr:hypothetical protein F4810DRAFT_676054 [Camillea tinctor]
MCVHTLIQTICQTCHRPVEPPTPGTEVRIAYCPQAWERHVASMRPLFAMPEAPPGFIPAGEPGHIPWPQLLRTPEFILNLPPDAPPSHPIVGPTAKLACQWPLPPPSPDPLPPSSNSLPPLSPSPTPPPALLPPGPASPAPEAETPPFELAHPRVAACHRCDPATADEPLRQLPWGSSEALRVEALGWTTYSELQPERYALMCARVDPEPEREAEDDGLVQTRDDILQSYDWVVHGGSHTGSTL